MNWPPSLVDMGMNNIGTDLAYTWIGTDADMDMDIDIDMDMDIDMDTDMT